MSIKALPADTIRLLDSSTLISSPVSLVKELVDNAIDAQATSIEVLISPNTIDKIEVRDNGHGILNADFAALGRRGHTSKLTRFDDLKEIGGTFLGFRGEGLASANTLGYVAVTTRTPSDKMATSFRLAPNLGGMAIGSQKPTPAPLGTTVAVTCLFASLPVRRRIAQRETTKTMASIKNLLCSYALARPQLRLAFKVFQQPALAWNYPAPPPATSGGHGLHEAIVMLFGNDVARRCKEVVASDVELLKEPSTLSQPLSSAASCRGFVFEAYLPRPGADLCKVAVGGFVSVDGRPLSALHNGVAKKLQALFRTHVSKCTVWSQQKHVRDAFLRLNIKCPQASYDPNVDSSKTDVLFTDEAFICSAFAKLCIQVYGGSENEGNCWSTSGLMPSSFPGRALISPPASCPAAVSEEDATREADQSPHTTGTNSNRHTHSSTALSLTTKQPALAVASSGQGITQLRSMFSGENGIRTAPVARRAATAATSTCTTVSRGSGRPVLSSLSVATVSHGGIQRNGLAAQRQIRSALQAGYRRSRRTCNRMQTPPSSGSLERYQGTRAARQRAESPDRVELPGLASNDGFRQTTISFGTQHRRQENDKEQDGKGVCEVTTHTRPVNRHETFITGAEFQRGMGNGISTAQTTEPTTKNQTNPGAWSNTGLVGTRDAGLGQSLHRWVATERPVYILEVDLRRLKRQFTRFVASGDWHRDIDNLSPDMAGISMIESRLREVATRWLAKTKPADTGKGPIGIEFYLRRSLEDRAKAVQR